MMMIMDAGGELVAEQRAEALAQGDAPTEGRCEVGVRIARWLAIWTWAATYLLAS
jgi:hypothetical protein